MRQWYSEFVNEHTSPVAVEVVPVTSQPVTVLKQLWVQLSVAGQDTMQSLADMTEVHDEDEVVASDVVVLSSLLLVAE